MSDYDGPERRNDYKILQQTMFAVETDLRVLVTKVETVIGDNDKLIETVYGNGQDGLTTRATSLENAFTSHNRSARFIFGWIFMLQIAQLGILIKILL